MFVSDKVVYFLQFFSVIFLDFAIDELKYVQAHVRLDYELNFTARHAHDTTLIAAVFEKLQLATDQLQEASKKYKMKINADKCKLISNSHIANSAYGRLRKSVWSRRDIPTKLKLRLYNALIQPIAIYGNETWFLTQLDTQKI